MTDLSLTAEQIEELRRLTRTAVGRVALRALMVLWRAEGLSTLEIAARLECDRQSITPWIDRYRALGVAGLYDQPRPGRPRHLDTATLDQVEAALEPSPPETDGPCARWTLARLQAAFAAGATRIFGVETLRRRLHERGLRWKRPRLWAWGEDPESFEKQLLIELAKKRAAEPAATPEEVIHFGYADASDQHLVAVLRGMWSRVGQQVRIATPPRNGHWALFGCLHLQTGLFLWQAFAKAISESFIAFLAYLLECYPTGQMVLVVDNASYHTSHAVVNWLKAHPRVLLLYLPSRRPHLNPVEKIWGALKDEVSANRSFANLLVLGQFIRAFFDDLTPARALSLAGVQENFREAA
jgi:transposase